VNLAVLEPATEAVLAELPRAGADEADAAVARAKAAYPAWRAVSPPDRARLLHRLADALAGEQERLAVLEARNAGKPIGDARGEMTMVVDTFRYYAGAVERTLGDTIPVAGGVAMTFREPLGVVALITPWNFPLTIASWKLAPCLAGGNTVVLKPAELTPLTALEFERIALGAGIPEGVVNVVAGPGSTCGARLVEHADVAKVAFTGSTEVGRTIAAGAARTIKRVTLELGGKSPNLVFADADLEAAAEAAPSAVFGNAGQDCCARSRILVQESVLDDFLGALARVVEGIRVGDPLDEATQMGPLISAQQRETVGSYVPDGAPVAARGSAPGGPGFWFPPTGRGRRAVDQLEHLGAREHAVRRLQAVGRRSRARPARARPLHRAEVRLLRDRGLGWLGCGGRSASSRGRRAGSARRPRSCSWTRARRS
jgi:acyl-CoA reductase-like NAD-dependent aldehyde dehydrogenase